MGSFKKISLCFFFFLTYFLAPSYSSESERYKQMIRFWEQFYENRSPIVIYYKDKHGNEVKEEVYVEAYRRGGGAKTPVILSNGMVIMMPNALFCWERVVKEEVAVASFIQKYSNVCTTENIPVEIELCDKSLGRGKSYMSTSFQTLADKKGMYVDDYKVHEASTWHPFQEKTDRNGRTKTVSDCSRTCFASTQKESKEEWKDLLSDLVRDVDELLEKGLAHLLSSDSFNLIYVPSRDERFHFVPRLLLFDFSLKASVRETIEKASYSIEYKIRRKKKILNRVVFEVLYKEYRHLKSLEGTNQEKEKVGDCHTTYCMNRLKWLLEEL